MYVAMSADIIVAVVWMNTTNNWNLIACNGSTPPIINPVIIPGIETSPYVLTESIVGTIANLILSLIDDLDASLGVAANVNLDSISETSCTNARSKF